jgi:predicted nucleic acid-binding protein
MSKDLDLKIVFEFTNKYEQLKKEGEISEEKFNEILSLLDNLDEISQKELENKLKDVT